MVTQVNARPGVFLDGVPVNANDLRLQLADATLTATAATGTTGIAATQGVRPGQGNPLLCAWTSGMSFTLNAGTCHVVGTASGTAGMYTATLDTATTLTVPTSDPTNPRIDSVIAQVTDVGTSSSTTVFKILPGTPAPSPVQPTLPANALRLANITVGAGVSVLSSLVFADKRVYTVGAGGILPYGNTSGATIPGPTGSYVHDLTSGRLKALDGSGTAIPPKVGAFTPVTATSGGASLASGGGSTVITTSVTVDGATEIEVVVTWESFQAAGVAAAGDTATMFLGLDGPGLGTWSSPSQWDYRQDSTDTSPGGGGLFTAWITPSAGTHAVYLTGESNQANIYNLGACALRVRPSLQ